MIRSLIPSWGLHSHDLILLLSPSSYSSCHTIGQLMERRVVGARNSNFIQKSSRPRRWWTCVSKNHLTQVRIQTSFIIKRKGVYLVAINFLMLKFFVFADVHISQITVFLEASNKTNGILCFTTCHLWVNRSVIPLKIRALRMGYSI